MKKELTPKFVSKVLKLDTKIFKAHYCVLFTNIEITNENNGHEIFMNIHEFIHTHCKDFLLSYANGLETKSISQRSDEDVRVQWLDFTIYLIVPNLLEGDYEHRETFTGRSELILYINAIEWLMGYRNDNPKISKFWVNKF